MTDQQIIEALRSGGDAREMAWKYMFTNWRKTWIKKINAELYEIDEAFNQSFLDFEKTVTAPGFELKSSLEKYLTKCVFNKWLRLKNGDRKENVHDEVSDVDSPEKEIIKLECLDLIESVIKVFDDKCKTILTMYNHNYNMEEIGLFMGFKSGAMTAKKEKYKCMLKLEKYLQDHPDIRKRLKDCLNHE